MTTIDERFDDPPVDARTRDSGWTGVVFSRKSDEWCTPADVYGRLHDEFKFTMDVAARSDNTKCDAWLGPDQPNPFWRDACSCPSWLSLSPGPFWMNPPYSQADAFMRKAAVEAAAGATVVALVPSRTDTRWWHRHVWDVTRHCPRPGVGGPFFSRTREVRRRQRQCALSERGDCLSTSGVANRIRETSIHERGRGEQRSHV